jgi:hypothetical protein
MTALGLRASSRLRLSSTSRSATSRFLPTRLPDLAFWYDAVGSVYDGGIWHDLSGKGNHAAQPLAARQPSRTTDEINRTLLRFDGANDALLVNAPPSLNAGLTLFVVYRVRTPVDFHGIFTASAASGTDHQQFFTLQYEQAVNRRIQVFGRSILSNQVVVQGVDSRETQYAIVTFDDDGVDVELRDLNGIKGDTSTFAPFGTPAVMVLGARYNQGAVFNFGAVDLYEVGLYTRELSSPERNQIESYLQRRHRLKWNPQFLGKDLAWFHDVDASGFTLSGGQVAQWNDLSGNSRHWTQASADKPTRTIDGSGRTIVQFDGVNDFLELAGPPPALEPFSVSVVYRMRDRSDFTGIVTAVPPAGADHSFFWTFRNASADSLSVQLFGRSAEVNQLLIQRADAGAAHSAVWTCASGTGQLRDALGSSADTYGGNFGAPTAILLGGRYGGAPFGHAAIDVLATVGASRALSVPDQQRLIDWATARWSL